MINRPLKTCKLTITPNPYLCAKILSSSADYQAEGETSSADPCSELDSHANMVVLGQNCFVFDGIKGKTCEVEPFDPSIGTVKRIPVVDAAIAYDCPYSLKTYVLLIRNALHVKTMDNNLIPPFILREARLEVNETPKIHMQEPTVKGHSIFFPENSLRIPLQLWGIFSFFHSRIPTLDEINDAEKLFLTPDSSSWNPYSDHFAMNEESMLDSKGQIHDKAYQKKHIIEEDDPKRNPSIMKQYYDDSVDTFMVSLMKAMSLSRCNVIQDIDLDVPLANISLHEYSQALSETNNSSWFTAMVGASSSNHESECDLFPQTSFQLDKDHPFFVNGVTTKKPSAVSADFLSKIWHIKPELAKRTIQQTTQLRRHGEDNNLSQRYSMNDRMLRYKRIESQFFTNTFFATEKGKSTRGHTCAQLFVSDKGFVSIYPLTSKGQFQEALHQFCKEVGVPSTLVVDPAGEQTSKPVRKFCHQVGTTLRVLEESTQWTNRAELYIGIFKESIRQDLSHSNCPMRLWDHCAERRARLHNVIPCNLFQLNGHTPITATLDIQGDISNICQFDWYDWCYYREKSNKLFPQQKRRLGWVLGPLKNEGNEMTQAVLNDEGRVVPRQTCQPLTTAELHSESEKIKRANFDKKIASLLGDSITIVDSKITPVDPDDDEILPEEDEPTPMPEEDPTDKLGIALSEKPFSDTLINVEVLLSQGENLCKAKVKGRT